tara:strand:+ start:869 stop:1264 length:396 start_codon:yes stop_codon:yes gene_type:complete
MIENIAGSEEILIPISIGELIDKISILKIKLKKMTGEQLINVKRELMALEAKVIEKNLKIDQKISSKLNQVNLLLWQIEDKIRLKEASDEFDDEFIQLARSVYQQNDKRASLKREINLLYNSQFVEEKLYH